MTRQKLYKLYCVSPFDGEWIEGYYLNKENAEADGIYWAAELEYFVRYEYGFTDDEDKIDAISAIEYYVDEEELKG